MHLVHSGSRDRSQSLFLPLNSLAEFLSPFSHPEQVAIYSFTNLPDGVTGTVLCKFFTTGTVAWVGAASSILTLAVVAIERYYAVVYPLGDENKFTINNLKVSLNDVVFISSA